jgi:hypothetical protein
MSRVVRKTSYKDAMDSFKPNMQKVSFITRNTVAVFGYQVGAVWFYWCKDGIKIEVDGYSQKYKKLDFQDMLKEANNNAVAKMVCSPVKVKFKTAFIIRYYPTQYGLDSYVKNDSYNEARKNASGSLMKKEDFLILKKLSNKQEKTLTANQLKKVKHFNKADFDRASKNNEKLTKFEKKYRKFIIRISK